MPRKRNNLRDRLARYRQIKISRDRQEVPAFLDLGGLSLHPLGEQRFGV